MPPMLIGPPTRVQHDTSVGESLLNCHACSCARLMHALLSCCACHVVLHGLHPERSVIEGATQHG